MIDHYLLSLRSLLRGWACPKASIYATQLRWGRWNAILGQALGCQRSFSNGVRLQTLGVLNKGLGVGIAICSYLKILMKYESGNVEHSNLDSTRIFCQWLVDFVDDTSIMLNLENLGYYSSAHNMLEAAIYFMEVWQRLVHISGGELDLTNSSYAMMVWKIKDGKDVLYTIDDTTGTLSIGPEKYGGMNVELRMNGVDRSQRQHGIRLNCGTDICHGLHIF